MDIPNAGITDNGNLLHYLHLFLQRRQALKISKVYEELNVLCNTCTVLPRTVSVLIVDISTSFHYVHILYRQTVNQMPVNL